MPRPQPNNGDRVALRLPAAAERFLAHSAICTLSTSRPDGSPHVTPVRFSWDSKAGLARVMTVGTRRKARNISENSHARASLCQLVGYSWLTLEGPATVSDDPQRVAEGIRWYMKRYGSSPPNLPGLVVIEIAAERVMGQYPLKP
jgi:F420H(2)-dependent biliverdin reductase